jgi:prolyl-tRNA synthetase
MIGKKTEREKFAGGVASTKLHYILPSGRIIEGPCFHYDGQNFAKAYDIKFLNKNGKEEYGYQCTYAISTRMLGAMFAMHSDKTGLIIPPKIAINKIVIIPIFNDENKNQVISESKKIFELLKDFSPILDDREDQRPGFKFNEYELKGIPIRIELGSRDLEKKEVTLVRRDNLKKIPIKINELKKEVPRILEEIQKSLFKKTKELFESKIEKTNNLESLKKIIDNKKVGIIPLCKNEKCEEMLKYETKGAKAVFISEKDKVKSEKCIICKKQADYFVYAGKSY